MRTVTVTIILLFLLSGSLLGQKYFGVSYKYFNPSGDFEQNVDNDMHGIAVNMLLPLKDRSRWYIGGEIGVAMYANEEYTYQLNSGATIDLAEEDCFWTLHGEVRYMVYQSPFIKTYLAGRLGITNFFSTIIPIKDNTGFRSRTNSHGTAFNAGLGAGIILNPGKLFNGTEGGWNIETGVNFHSGSKTSYRYMPESQQSIVLDDGKYYSLTNYTELRIALLFQFRH